MGFTLQHVVRSIIQASEDKNLEAGTGSGDREGCCFTDLLFRACSACFLMILWDHQLRDGLAHNKLALPYGSGNQGLSAGESGEAFSHSRVPLFK